MRKHNITAKQYHSPLANKTARLPYEKSRNGCFFYLTALTISSVLDSTIETVSLIILPLSLSLILPFASSLTTPLSFALLMFSLFAVQPVRANAKSRVKVKTIIFFILKITPLALVLPRRIKKFKKFKIKNKVIVYKNKLTTIICTLLKPSP